MVTRRALGLLAAGLVLTSALDAARRHPIIYVQAVRYKPSMTQAQAGETLRSLKRTLGKIPQVRSIRIGRVAHTSVAGYEYAVVMEFDSLEDLKTYGQSEIHRRWVKEHVGDSIDQHLTLTVDTTALEQQEKK